MRIGLIINILIIFLIIFYTLFIGLVEYFVKWRIKSMHLNYSWSGNPKANTNFHDMQIHSPLFAEIRDKKIYEMPVTEEVNDLLDFDINLPIVQYENEHISEISAVKFPPSNLNHFNSLVDLINGKLKSEYMESEKEEDQISSTLQGFSIILI
ncbi:unnamed protein product [Moneuplotes crassus]|uniref:Uncharacterized protein n=1 Tax=Euplotes crassus TaxID=5936 RepID=A0AAD2D8G8_EUPCR|nr:unnamed protein product [Moneuplotes crassus]